MGALATFQHAIGEARTREALKLRVLDRVGDTLGADRTGLYLLEPGTLRPSEIHVRHLPEAFVLQYEQLGRDEDRVLARVMQTGRAAYDEEAFGEEGWRRSVLYRSFGNRYRIRHYLCAPIFVGGALAGTLNLGRSSEVARFDRQVSARAQAVADWIGARLAALSVEREGIDRGRLSVKESGQLRAERAMVRGHLERIEHTAERLSAEQAAAYFHAFARDTLKPLDTFDRDGRRYVLLRPEPAAAPAARRLTAREIDVLAHVAVGASNKEIAYELGMATSTVATHVSSAMAKLGVRSRVELVEALLRRETREPK